MAFWIGWALWQKLSAVLGFLITLVLIYAFCVLAYNRWMERKYAAAEARQKGEEAELFPILAEDDIPFGARALQQGIQIEGIWVSNHNSPVPSPRQPGTPSESRPSTPALKSLKIPDSPLGPPPALEKVPTNHSNTPSLPPYTRLPPRPEAEIVPANQYIYQPQRPGGIYSPVMASSGQTSPTNFKCRSEAFPIHAKRSGFHNRLVRKNQPFDPKPRAIPVRRGEPAPPEAGSVENGMGAYRPVEQQRAGRMTKVLLRRSSSEEFRRRMSAIFNEQIPMNSPAEGLQFDSVMREPKRRSFRKSILGHFQA